MWNSIGFLLTFSHFHETFLRGFCETRCARVRKPCPSCYASNKTLLMSHFCDISPGLLLNPFLFCSRLASSRSLYQECGVPACLPWYLACGSTREARAPQEGWCVFQKHASFHLFHETLTRPRFTWLLQVEGQN